MIDLIKKGVKMITPVIIKPKCYEFGLSQNCFSCKIKYNSDKRSTLCLCAKAYDSHRKGCPNYGKKNDCPPNMPMFDEVFDLNFPVYVLYSAFDIKKQINDMKERHPNWTEKQCRCCLYWQGTARKIHNSFLNDFSAKNSDYLITNTPEAMGVDITETMSNIGVELEWPCNNITYRVSIAGRLKEELCQNSKIRGKKLCIKESGILVCENLL